ncbi:MAG: hypothetical protein A3D24_02760 [Candidatus Blackburnbacteria bacterium RIFCSPHIGHO2_02_FULL_39_13]|uniref:Uncharacterized protein n=1 Tax=Candidatus Blackburnbacteria bacterium RIFCSPLOWO2_01_FULL_40_20 TaxID=1797519 RepID=A0A1G1VBK0_9BACT|nr:MAG: hypothetical protein A2694_01665 [Candidatus Blackburnbacteria bacterium RIFCSPHIGHO2_01_FULL_40_17]OGY07746.1 MAG: hypothetical protein A3D24_02760 [Candidatus Blackburnbacteria bacterium RIFCSPHIGHO2_02_FULL_39_13]OGY12805.1 MAG: hypothetical protein A3A77_02925 [Candidatus Blackburnbacteria bacterium RIFCSPLOWO2_01_FULL_40_20]
MRNLVNTLRDRWWQLATVANAVIFVLALIRLTMIPDLIAVADKYVIWVLVLTGVGTLIMVSPLLHRYNDEDQTLNRYHEDKDNATALLLMTIWSTIAIPVWWTYSYLYFGDPDWNIKVFVPLASAVFLWFGIRLGLTIAGRRNTSRMYQIYHDRVMKERQDATFEAEVERRLRARMQARERNPDKPPTPPLDN